MVLFLHNRYRSTGGEERVVADLAWLVREHLGEPAQLLARDSAAISGARAAAGLLRGGLRPADVERAVRASGARVVHAHNLLPALGWRALAAARDAGARVVIHLHQYRLVCAVGVCFTHGEECTRCHGRNTLPGIARNCRASLPEALTYAAALALWQRRMLAQADAVIVPSRFARERLRELGAPLPWERVVVLAPPIRAAAGRADGGERAGGGGAAGPGESADGAAARNGAAGAGEERAPDRYALVVSRLAPEKGVDVAIDACRMADMTLVVAGQGPQEQALRQRATGARVRFAGHVDERELARLRAGAAIALVPSRSGETFALAAAEAMADGVPVAASRVGALPELVPDEALAPPGDARALAQAIDRLAGDRDIAARGRERVRALCSPQVVASALAGVYDGGDASARST